MKKLLILLAALALFWGAYQQFKAAPEPSSKLAHTGLLISHKTAGQDYPENAEKGFRASLAMDVDGIEIDVHVVKDNQVVLHHDPVLSNYNCFAKDDDTRLIVAQQTAETLKAVECRNYKINTLGEPYKIVSLADFLDIYGKTDQSKQLLIEIKVWDELIENNPLHVGLDSADMHYPDTDVAKAVYAVLRQYPGITNIQFNTFSRDLLLELKAQKRPDEAYDFGLLYKGHYGPILMALPALFSGEKCYDFCWVPDYSEVRQWLDANNIRTFIPHFGQATSLPFRRGFQRHIMAGKDDLTVIPWTLNTPADWSKYESGGFDGILTDTPSGFLKWLEK